MKKYLFFCLLFLHLSNVFAENIYPNRPIRIVLPVSVGGGTDIVTRIIAQHLSKILGESVIVDNKPGSGGNLAADLVAHAKPDGYTLIVVTASHATNSNLYKKLSYDPINDFSPISQLTSQPYLFVINNNVPAKTIKEFIVFAQNNTNINYASSGKGLLGHLGMEQLKMAGNFDATHIPYKGAGPALIDTVAGHVHAFLPTIVSGLPFAKQGQVRLIAVTSPNRLPSLPNIPTIAESGFPGYEVLGWYGLLAPAGTPKLIITKLNEAVKQALNNPEVREKISADGADPVGSSPEQFEEFLSKERIRWAKIIKTSKIESD
jgi:tripartite-type tricarboxylate transporter receptor subunit TctC